MLFLLGIAQPGYAQVSMSLAAETDLRFRGHSLSEGRPAVTAQLSYDHESGLYLNGSLSGVDRRDGPDLLGYHANLGFVRRLGPDTSIDAGLVHFRYRYNYYGQRLSAHYTEAYVGVHVHNVAARLFYSPHYFQANASTLYGEVEADFEPAPDWRLSAHVGGLKYVKKPYHQSPDLSIDWRVRVGRQLGQLEVHAALSGGRPGTDYYNGESHSRTALTAGASVAF